MTVLQYLCLVFLVIHIPADLNAQQTAATRYFLEKTKTQIKPFSLQAARNGQLLTSNLEQFRDLLASAKYFLTQQYYSDYKANFKHVVKSGKVQQQIDPAVPFPCGLNNTRSTQPPSSVHELRPGDIDIIGAMGDSLTAGTAMMSKSLSQSLIEFRGQTALGGGLKDWRSFLTLPNILKEFNPNLYGQSVANTLAKFRPARFNVAEPFAIMQDMPYMAEVLVKRMQNDAKVNMTGHWKLVSIFIGANDICNEMCFYDKTQDFLENHRKHLYKTLTILRDNIPRLIVNLVVIPFIDNILRSMKNAPAYCRTLHAISCTCILGYNVNSKQSMARHEIIKRLQQIDIEVASLAEFQLEEFTVVPRTLGINNNLMLLKNGSTDLKYFSIDCFHFSQLSNALFTNMLWNKMLQVKTKPTIAFLKPFEVFVCPTKEKPFIKTLKNS